MRKIAPMPVKKSQRLLSSGNAADEKGADDQNSAGGGRTRDFAIERRGQGPLNSVRPFAFDCARTPGLGADFPGRIPISEVYRPEASGQMSDCLHCDINEIVQKYIDKADTADAADIAARMAESIADMILTFVPEDDQANVLAHTIAHLGEMFLQKGGAAEGDTTH
jgi:hypothetical protein